MGPQADILIVTVTNVESQSVIRTFEEANGQKVSPVTIAERVYHDLGKINGIRVFMAISEMGAGGLGASQQAVQKGIAALSPNAVIMVGVAFGINEKKQKIGDVLVSRQLMLYDLQRVGVCEIIPRGDRPHASPRLLNHLQSANLRWDKAKVHFGVLLTGEKLVDSIDYRTQLQKLESEAIGGEMEGGGLYVACHDAKVDWILVKAICDWADGNKSEDKDSRQRLAADHAADFVCHALQYAPLTRTSRIHSLGHIATLNGTIIPLPLHQCSIPTRESVRRLLEEIFRTDSDFEAFCLDRFPNVKKKFANGNDRTQKLNLLLEMEDLRKIISDLTESHPVDFAQNIQILQYVNSIVDNPTNDFESIIKFTPDATETKQQVPEQKAHQSSPSKIDKRIKTVVARRLNYVILSIVTLAVTSVLFIFLSDRVSKSIPPGLQKDLHIRSVTVLSQIDWIYVPGGTFLMGSTASEANNSPIHEVSLSPFYASRTEVTVSQYQECFRAGNCAAPKDEKGCNWSLPEHQEHPINCITWYDANNFARWKNARLPTEAEWEFIASLGGTSRFPWGNEPPKCRKPIIGELCNDGCEQGTCIVCSSSLSAENSRGFCDLIGNVWEWCQDWHGPYTREKQTNPIGSPRGISRVVRGGSWVQSNNDIDARTRNWRNPNTTSTTTGFRIVRND